MRSYFVIIIVGAALTFLIAPGVLIATAVVMGTTKGDLSVNFFSIYALYGSVAVCIFFVFGTPIVFLYRRMGWESLAAFALGGAFVAIAGEVLLVATGIGYWDISDALSFAKNTAILGVCGLMSGVGLWAVTRAGRKFRIGRARGSEI